MAATRFQVVTAYGDLNGTGAPGPYAGPSNFYQGTTLLDPRYTPANKDQQGAAEWPAFMSSALYVVADGIPSASGTAALAPAANATSGTAFTLITATSTGAAAGVCSLVTNFPLLPFRNGNTVSALTGTVAGGTTTPVKVLALDVGFTTGTTVAANVTIGSIPDSGVCYVGQWLVIGGCGDSANKTCQVVQVTGIPSASAITVTPAPVAALVNAAICSANAYGPFPASLTANAGQPYWWAGEAAVLAPREAFCRTVSISGSSSAAGISAIVAGYDVYGVAMHEKIVATTGALTTYGKKAFKYITSVTPLTTDANNYTVGVSDVFGFNLRADNFDKTETFYNGSLFTGPNTSGFTQALQATGYPSTFTNGDVRGTLQVSSSGGSATGATATATNGTSIRLTMAVRPGVWNATFTSAVNLVPLFGTPQI